MKTLNHILLIVPFILLLPLVFVLRLFGWRPQRQNELQSVFPTKSEGFAVVSPERSEREPYPYVQVNNDGGARELLKTERKHLETPFVGGDGGRPYVKWRYGQKNGWGELGGYLKRTRLPRRVNVAPAPVEEPKRDAKGEMIRRAREMGYDIIENANGSTTMVPSKMFRSDL